MTGIFLRIISCLFMVFLMTEFSHGRMPFDREEGILELSRVASDVPYVTIAVHNIGKIGLTVSNAGLFGNGYFFFAADPVTGARAPSCQYPYPNQFDYLWGGAFWIGAVVGRDTLVSTAIDGWAFIYEMWPDPYPQGEILRRSINQNDSGARSEQDFIAVFTDTVTNPQYVALNFFDGRPHIPLNIEVTQRTYAWSYNYADDFILFDYAIKNIGRRRLTGVYMGFYVDSDVGVMGLTNRDFTDDICGFRREFPSQYGCGFMDTINIAWIADNDGRPLGSITPACPAGFSLTAVTGVRVVRTPSDSLQYSFNWWVSNPDPSLDFGPRQAGTEDEPFRDFGGFLGTPEGDRTKYYVMSREEFDYDQLFSAVDNSASGWLPPAAEALDIADGYDTRFVLSCGPFDIGPGEILPFSFAYVAGENFHTECEAFGHLYNANFPEAFYEYLDFEELARNAVWASSIYDNPGYDTDGDGYRGKFRICVFDSSLIIDTLNIDPPVMETTVVYLEADTVYYMGDGVPDFRGASPPPAPKLRIFPRINRFNEGELRIRWSGLKSETERDIFSNQIDFEGYRVYQSLTQDPADFVMVTSYDRDNFKRFIWEPRRSDYEQREPPFSLDSLQKLYGAEFDPLTYHRDNPFRRGDSTYYFARQDWNRSGLEDTNFIHKLYPDQPYPSTFDVDSARIYFPYELTEEGYFKYFEYEYTLRHLLPSQLYYVTVTAFDYGSPGSGLEALESSPTQNLVAEYAQNAASMVAAERLKVVVYPNPYRIDGNYRSQPGGGFEGRGEETLPDERTRRIHFTNLPHRCKIRIFTLDGDLVREIDHDYPIYSPQSMHEEWDLITRNTQAVVSGIYYYAVESEDGTQVGKIVIIM